MTHARLFGRFILCGLLGALLPACSARSPFPTDSGDSGTGGAGATTSDGVGDSTGVGLVFDGGFGGGGTGCAPETQFIYTLANDNSLYKFDPPAATFTLIGTLQCTTSTAIPFSMAVDRNANAWSVFTNGDLFKIDTTTAACTPLTSFVPGQNGFTTTFGMGFSTDAPGSSAETLYVSESDFGTTVMQRLAKIDTQTLTLTPIQAYDAIHARAELTGTGDAKLYGAFEGSPYIVAEIEKSDAKILSQAPQTPINVPPDTGTLAFASWAGDFFIFAGPGSSTKVFRYQPSTGTTTLVKSVTFGIVGAGVSTCAPFAPLR